MPTGIDGGVIWGVVTILIVVAILGFGLTMERKLPKPQVKVDGCYSCSEEMPLNECPSSKRECGHHCNHSWTHEICDWCGLAF